MFTASDASAMPAAARRPHTSAQTRPSPAAGHTAVA
jgi:hypothetical protein